mmetsp:Transcript_103678/g.324384  ORF Transcript_103678/g.324384 Transcript_103678/m.324384 type:complete len:289 (+) Transcript_103678:768-1634(+)
MGSALRVGDAQETDGRPVVLSHVLEGDPRLRGDQEGHIQVRGIRKVSKHREEVLPAHGLRKLPGGALAHDQERAPGLTAIVASGWRPRSEPACAHVERGHGRKRHKVRDLPGAVVALHLPPLGLRVHRMRAALRGQDAPEQLVTDQQSPQRRSAQLEDASSGHDVPPLLHVWRHALVGVGQVADEHWLLRHHAGGGAEPEVPGAQEHCGRAEARASLEAASERQHELGVAEVARLLIVPIDLDGELVRLFLVPLHRHAVLKHLLFRSYVMEHLLLALGALLPGTVPGP